MSIDEWFIGNLEEQAERQSYMNPQCQAILPRPTEVLDVHVGVPLCLALAPEQKTCFSLLQISHCNEYASDRSHLPSLAERPSSLQAFRNVQPFATFRAALAGANLLDIGDSEAQDQRPNHAQNELEVAVDNVCG